MSAFFQSASTLFGMVGQMQEGNAAAANYLAEAQADRFNARVADQMAKSETERAGADAIDFRRAQSAKANTAFAARAGSGLSVATGTLAFVDEKIFQEIEFGVQRIIHGGQVASTRLRNQASLLRASARANKQSAENVLDAARLSAFSTGLRGFSASYTSLAGGGSSSAGWGGSSGPLDIRPTSATFAQNLPL